MSRHKQWSVFVSQSLSSTVLGGFPSCYALFCFGGWFAGTVGALADAHTVQQTGADAVVVRCCHCSSPPCSQSPYPEIPSRCPRIRTTLNTGERAAFLGHVHRPDCFKISLCGICRPVRSPIASRTATFVDSNGTRGGVHGKGRKSKAVGSNAVPSME